MVKREVFEALADVGQLLVVGLLLDLLLFNGVESFGLVRIGVVAALLAAVLKSYGWLVLFALQASLFMREPSRPEMVLGLVPWMYGLTGLSIVAYTFLGRSFRSRLSKWLVEQTLFVFEIEERSASQISQGQIHRPNWLKLVATQFVIWAAITLLAMLALMRLPISVTARSQWFRHALENDSTVWPGATMLVLSLLLVILFMEASWRQMTSAQASLYLRSSFVLDHYRDLKMIVLRRLKINKKLLNVDTSKKQLVERVADASPR